VNYNILLNDGSLKVKIEGDIDLYNVYDLKDEIKARLGDNQYDMLLDMGGVSYIDSSGIGMLVELKKVVEKNGKEYKLVNVPDAVMNLFHKISLDTLLGNNIIKSE
jgi:anti-sigma B factor antagonist